MYHSSIRNIEGNYLVLENPGDTEPEEFPVQPRPEITTTELNKKINYSAILGAGVNYKIGLNYLVFEARYSMGMLNTIKSEERWGLSSAEVRDLKFPTGHVYDDLKLNNLSFFIGFVKPLYKPRKIK
jgi:hypothetical protein